MGAPALGVLHPGVRFPRQLRYRSRLLFHWRAADAFLGHDPTAHLLKPVTGETPTFTRASTGGLTTDSRGRLRQWAQGMPRLEYVDLDGDGVFETPGLLLESARTNIILFSQAFDDAGWSKTGLDAVSANTDVAPDGARTAETLGADGSTGDHYASRNTGVAGVVATTYTMTAYAEASVGSWLWCGEGGGANWHRAWFNLATGTVGTTQNATAVITALPDGWYRCEVRFTRSDTPNLWVYVGLATVDGSTTFTDSTIQHAVWGLQLETGAYATSYVATTSAVVARAADQLKFAHLVPPQASTYYVRYVERAQPAWALVGSIEPTILLLGSSPIDARLQVYKVISDDRYRVQLGNGASSVDSTVDLNPIAGDRIELLVTLQGDGKVQIRGRKNEGAVVTGVQSAALAMPSAWNAQEIHVGSVGSAGGADILVRELKVAAGVHTTFDAMRRMF